MNKTVLIKANNSILFPNDVEDDSIVVAKMYQSEGNIAKFVRFILYHFGISIPSILYNRELKNMKADLFVIQDADTQICFLKWMRKHHPDERIILWYWNTVEEQQRYLDPLKVPSDVEKWSYSRYDCKRYKMTYNTTFYPYPVREENRKTNPLTDVFFIGKDKGRMKKILNLKNELERHGLSTDFCICPTRLRDRKKAGYSQMIPYDGVVDKIIDARAILDCSVSDSAGPTIRPLEALFWRRKLITDDKSIMNEDYYDPQNVFVIGVDNMDDILEFVRGEYHINGYESGYTISAWMKRFYQSV